MTFYVYRVEGDKGWPLSNKNAGNLAGMLWYLQNEVVWRKGGRHGTYFSTPVTKLVRYKISLKATQPLYDLGMNFGVMNTMDSNKCSGPWRCDNLARYGGAMGCETWNEGNPNNFPHQQWLGLNQYPDATWYSLPVQGLCPDSVATPTGTGDCTYKYERMGHITIDQLEGIEDYSKFVEDGGREYDPKTDTGVHNSFWNGFKDGRLCQWRVEQAKRLFGEKYPWQAGLEEPTCDFNKFKFYPKRLR